MFESGDVLLVVDVLNSFDHEDGDALLESFRARAGGMRRALADARARDVPVVYVNDAHGAWDGDRRVLLERTLAEGPTDVLRPLLPADGEALLLKHRYSAFDHTPLELLLLEVGARRLLLMGSAVEGCVLQSAIDAREHGLKVTILRDACATTDAELEAVALAYGEKVVGARLATVGG